MYYMLRVFLCINVFAVQYYIFVQIEHYTVLVPGVNRGNKRQITVLKELHFATRKVMERQRAACRCLLEL